MVGPTSGLLATLAAWLAVVCSFGIGFLRKAFHYLFMIALCPLKLLDYLFTRFPGADMIASSLYVVVRKPASREGEMS